MARRKIKSATDQRPFIMVYQDFLESELLDNHYQKLVYVYLKKFANSKNQCFPSIKKLSKLTKIGATKIKQTLVELEQKGVIRKDSRIRPDGGTTSNLYTLYDTKELWNVGSSEEVAAVVDEYEDEKLISLLEAKGYTIIKEKEPETTEPAKDQLNQAPKLNQYDRVNTTLNSEKSQAIERYSMEQVRILYDHDVMINDYPEWQQDIDAVMCVLHTALNSTKQTIRVGGEDKPSMVVIGKLMKLTYSGIMYAIQKYNEQTERIKNPTSYMLTLLYNAEEQMRLDIANQVQHDLSNWQPIEE